MPFTDDLRGLSQAEQVARVQAVAREHGDALTELEAGNALSLYTTQAPDGTMTTIHASRERGMMPLTLPADRARSYAEALEANGFTVRLEAGS